MKPGEIPIEKFVNDAFNSKRIQRYMESWRVENDLITRIITRNFRDMGIFSVSKDQSDILFTSLVEQLRHSPEIVKSVRKAEMEEAARKRSRHAD